MQRMDSGRRSALWSIGLVLVLAFILTACNLNTGVVGDGQTAISGPPTVQIAAPPANATFLENIAVNIQALIGNAGTDIARIEISVDGTVIETLESPNPGGAPSFSIAQSWQASGVGQHTIDVVAFRADGSSSVPVPVTINVISTQPSPTATTQATTSGSSQNTPTTGSQQAQPTSAPTNPPAPTDPPPPAATSTPSVPYVTINQGINVRSGPGTIFNPPIGSLAANDTAELLARSPDGQWFKIKYYNGTGWVFASFTSPSVDPGSLQVDAGPPPPAPTATPLPTAIPATAAPATTANLVLGNVGLSPDIPFTCGQTVAITMDIANLGSAATTNGGSISIQDIHVASGQVTASTSGAFGPINAGQTINVGGMFLTVTTYVGEQHKLVVRVNPDGAVAETVSGDNNREWTYTLNAGC